MPERMFRNVEIDLDDLADALVDWFQRDGFVVQDFLEGPTIYLQAKKENLLTKFTFSSQALNVRLTPLARGFKVDVAAGEWLDKVSGAGVAGLALKFINPFVALGAASATGYGVYQQLKLPERILDFIEIYVDEHGRLDEELEDRRPRGRTSRADSPKEPAHDTAPRRGSHAKVSDAELDDEIDALRREAGRVEPDIAATAVGSGFCAQCGARLHAGAAFCHQCGTKTTPTTVVEDDDEGGTAS